MSFSTNLGAKFEPGRSVLTAVALERSVGEDEQSLVAEEDVVRMEQVRGRVLREASSSGTTANVRDLVEVLPCEAGLSRLHPRMLVVYPCGITLGEVGSIIWCKLPLPHLPASHRGHEEGPASREEAEFRRTQSAQRVSGPVGRKKPSGKLTAAHSVATTPRNVENEPVTVYYDPGAFELLPELEVAA